MTALKMLAIDLGASNGRGIIGSFDGKSISLEDIHRFENGAITVNGSMHWNILGLYQNILTALQNAKSAGHISSMGIDTWGVDYGLLDKNGKLLGIPYSYRDSRTANAVDNVRKKISDEEMYKLSGLQIMNINTLYQLCSEPDYIINNAEIMLCIPDLLNYFLTGLKMTEHSIASTTQMLSPNSLSWNTELLDKLGLPRKLFTEVKPSGTILGPLSDSVLAATGINNMPVVMSASHDTASAVVATPALGEDFVFISCGTWSLMGVECDTPVLTDTSFAEQYSNEKGAFKKTLLLRNIMGLWLLQEVRRIWKLEGKSYSYAELAQLAREADDISSVVDPDASCFVAPSNMVSAIAEYCAKTGQYIPQTIGETVKCILQSLALKYRLTITNLERITGKTLPAINIIGGGVNNTLLCQMTADCTGLGVIAGPDEATAMGNLLTQAYALGEIGSLAEMREVVRNSVPTVHYRPVKSERWDALYEKFINLPQM